MNLNHRATKKEFAREIFFGCIAVVCLFAIFLFVAIQKSTGRSLSPLAYLWPQEKDAAGEYIPVVVFKTEKDRQEAQSQYENPKPKLEAMVARFKESTKRHREKRLANQKTKPSQQPPQPNLKKPNLIPIISSPGTRLPDNQDSASFGVPSSLEPAESPFNHRVREKPSIQNPREFAQLDASKPPVSAPLLPSQTTFENQVQPVTSVDSPRAPLAPPPAKATQLTEKVEPKATPASFEIDAQTGKQNHSQTPTGFQASKIAQKKEKNFEPQKQQRRVTPRANDSFWSLAVDHYNDGRHFASLARFNGCVENIDDLPTTVWVPSLAELKAFASRLDKQKKADSSPGDQAQRSVFYLTHGGETLFDIARENLGAGPRYVEILKSNAQRLPPQCNAQTILQKGIHLLLPAR